MTRASTSSRTRSRNAPFSVDERLTAPTPSTTPVFGHLEGIDDEGRVLFRPEETGAQPVSVIIGIAIDDGELVRAARNQTRALVFECGGARPERVLAGLLRERVSAKARDAAPGDLVVQVDGETLNVSAQKEILLSCGKSSLLLRHDGRVVLSGTYVVSKSRGPNKIKGATIALN